MTLNTQLKSGCDLRDPEVKRAFNEAHFTESAPRYDLATRLLSFGRDRAWKRRLINGLPPLLSPVCLDLACGTGDLAFALARRYPLGVVEGLDLTEAMLRIARLRNTYKNLAFAAGDMNSLKYPDNYADIITGGYALRNSPNLKEMLAGVRRVLKPGGVAAFLDFSKPARPILQGLEYWVLRLWGSFWGIVLHGSPAVHGYIAASLKLYPARPLLSAIFEDCGLKILRRKLFLCGVIEISVLQKCG